MYPQDIWLTFRVFFQSAQKAEERGEESNAPWTQGGGDDEVSD